MGACARVRMSLPALHHLNYGTRHNFFVYENENLRPQSHAGIIKYVQWRYFTTRNDIVRESFANNPPPGSWHIRYNTTLPKGSVHAAHRTSTVWPTLDHETLMRMQMRFPNSVDDVVIEPDDVFDVSYVSFPKLERSSGEVLPPLTLEVSGFVVHFSFRYDLSYRDDVPQKLLENKRTNKYGFVLEADVIDAFVVTTIKNVTSEKETCPIAIANGWVQTHSRPFVPDEQNPAPTDDRFSAKYFVTRLMERCPFFDLEERMERIDEDLELELERSLNNAIQSGSKRSRSD